MSTLNQRFLGHCGAADRKRRDRLIKTLSSGRPLDSVQVVGETRTAPKKPSWIDGSLIAQAGHRHNAERRVPSPQECEVEASQVRLSCCRQTVRPALLPAHHTEPHSTTGKCNIQGSSSSRGQTANYVLQTGWSFQLPRSMEVCAIFSLSELNSISWMEVRAGH